MDSVVKHIHTHTPEPRKYKTRRVLIFVLRIEENFRVRNFTILSGSKFNK